MDISQAVEMLFAAALQGDVIKTNQWAMYIRASYTAETVAAFLTSTFGTPRGRAMSLLTGGLAILAPALTPWRK